MILPVQVAFELHCPQLSLANGATRVRQLLAHVVMWTQHQSMQAIKPGQCQGILPPPKYCSYTLIHSCMLGLCGVVKGRLLHLMPLNVSFTVHRGLCATVQVPTKQKQYVPTWPATMITGLNGPVRAAVTNGRCIALVFTLFTEYCHELKNTYTDVKDMLFGILLRVPISYGGQCCQ